MKPGERTFWIVMVVCATVMVLAVKCAPDQSGLAAENRKLKDSLTITESAHRAEIDRAFARADSVIRSADALRVESSRNAMRSQSAALNALSIRRQADSLSAVVATLATDAEKVPVLTAALTARTEERDSLAKAYELQEDATELALTRGDSLQSLIVSDLRPALILSEGRLAAQVGYSAGLEAQVAQLSKPCKIVGLIKCPSRIESLAIGAVLGAAAIYLAPR